MDEQAIIAEALRQQKTTAGGWFTNYSISEALGLTAPEEEWEEEPPSSPEVARVLSRYTDHLERETRGGGAASPVVLYRFKDAFVASQQTELADAAPSRAKRYRSVTDVHLLFVDDRGRVLLGRRSNTGWCDGYWHLPAGHLDEGESLLTAAAREAKEELGVEIREDDLRFAHLMHNAADDPRISTFFQVMSYQGRPTICEPDKCSGLGWFAADELPKPLVAYAEQALDQIKAGRRFSLHNW